MAEKDVNLWSMNGKTPEAKIAALEKENQALRERIAELERRLGIDSNNSSKPPLIPANLWDRCSFYEQLLLIDWGLSSCSSSTKYRSPNSCSAKGKL